MEKRYEAQPNAWLQPRKASSRVPKERKHRTNLSDRRTGVHGEEEVNLKIMGGQ